MSHFLGRLCSTAAATALACTGLLPLTSGVAHADKPEREVYTDAQTYVVNDICAFPVTVTSTFSKTTQTTFTDRDGEVIRIALQITEQDVFTANGKTLSGLPYRFNSQLLFEDGELVHGYASGNVVRVPLPGGKVFRASGRVDFVARGADFILVPDVGTPVNTGAFCAALT
jgi:hypothetical protein